MLDRKNLYCLREFSNLKPGTASSGLSEREYNGQLMLSGPDAAIEIRGSEIRGYVNGTPSHQSGQLAAMIDNYDASILQGAQRLRQNDTDTVVLAGKWHHVEFEMEPRFEAYIVHVQREDGTVRSSFYQSEIFDWDYPGDGGGFGIVMTGDQSEDVKRLRRKAEFKINLDDHRYVSSSGLPSLDGILWYPADGVDLPIVISHVSGMKAYEKELRGEHQAASETTGGSATLGDRAATNVDDDTSVHIDDSSMGHFRGNVVDRKTHRPPEMTVDEMLASTDSSGYWSQTWNGNPMEEPYSMYTVPTGEVPRGTDILRRLDAPQARHSFGNAYATDWEAVPGCPSTMFRILAVGPHPLLDIGPI